MAVRSLLRYTSGTIPAQVGVLSVLYDQLTQQVKSFRSAGLQAWEFYDQVNSTSGSIDRVYHSVGHRSINGGAGDTSLFFRLVQNSAAQMQANACQDWVSADKNAGAIGANAAEIRSALGGATSRISIADNTTTTWHSFVNEYSIVFVILQGTTPDVIVYSKPHPSIHPSFGGSARIVTATTGTGEITLELDRELSGTVDDNDVLQPGQRVWIVNQTPTGSSAVSDFTEIALVKQVGNQKLTVSGVINSPYASGSLVSVGGNTQVVGASTNSTLGLYATTAPDTTWVGNNLQTVTCQSLLSNTALSAADNDPNNSNLFLVTPFFVESTLSTKSAFLGSIDCAALSTYNTSIHSAGVFLTGSGEAWVIFPETQASSKCLAVGPIDISDLNITGAQAWIHSSQSLSDDLAYAEGVYEHDNSIIEWVADPNLTFDNGADIVQDAPTIVTTARQIYYQRALDVGGTGGYVYWTTFDEPDPNPLSGDTTPNFTGTLEGYTIVRILTEVS